MVNYADCLLDSIETGISEYMKHNPTTTAVQVEIVDILDNVKGSYQVKYRDNLFVAHASNSGVYYKIGDKVYILVPDGNFDNPKIIIGKTAPSSDIIEQEDLSQGTYIHTTDNLLTDTINQISLCSFSSLDTRTIEPLTNFKANLIRHFNDYKIYSLSCEIKTAFPMKQTARGNYGIKLQIPCYQLSASGEEEEITKEVILNSENLLGNPYSLIEWTKQEVYFQLNEITRINSFKDIKVYAYADNFLTSADEPADIFIKNIEVAAVEVIPADKKEGFQLTLKGSPSNIFLQDVSDITLIPQLTLNGVITNIENYDCYWFVEDFSITSDHNLYSNIGGAGWLCLNDRTELIENNNVNYIYDTKKYSHLVYETDIASALKYKCAVVINNNIISDTIEVKLVNPSISIDLKTETGSTTFIKDMGNIPLICDVIGELHSNAVLEFKWIRNDKNNNFIEFLNTNKITLEDIENGKRAKISFPSSLVQDVNFIKVQVIENWIYNDNLYSRNLGSKQITINTSDNIKYSIRIDNGNKLYKYDSDGDSPLVADYDGPVSSRITSILPLNYRLFKTQENGVEFSEEEYLNCKAVWKIPKKSMININAVSSDNIIIDKESDEDFNLITINKGREDIAYTISSKYFPTKKDETVFLEVSFKNEKILTSTTINFIKEGENGTNGSKYTAIITYDGYEYEELDANGNQRKLIMEYETNNFAEDLEWNDWKQGWNFYSYYDDASTFFDQERIGEFQIKLYKDSEEILVQAENVTWSIFDAEISDSFFSIFPIDKEDKTPTAKLTFFSEIKENGEIVEVELPKEKTWFNAELDPCIIVQAKIQVGNITDNNSMEYIYAYYPIELVRIDVGDLSSITPNFISGYSSVLYASDGTNPMYNNEPFEIDNLIEEDMSYIRYTWETSNNFVKGIPLYNKYNIFPKTKYDGGDSKNYIKVTTSLIPKSELDEYYITYLEEKLQEYQDIISNNEKEIVNLNVAIDELKEKASLLKYQNWISEIEEYKEYINSRSVLLQSLDVFYNEIQSIYNNSIFKEFINNNIDLLQIFTSFENNYYNSNKNILLGIEENNFENFIIRLEEDNQKASIQTIYNFTDYMQKEDNVALFLRLDKLNSLNQKVILNYQNFKVTQKENYINFYNSFANIQNIFKELTYKSTYNDFLNDVTKILIKKFRTDFYNVQEVYTFFEDIKSICEPYYDLYNFTIQNYLIQKLNNNIDIINKNKYYYVNKENIYEQIEAYYDSIDNKVIYIKPVIMLYNRYGMSNINDWDGNKLYIDENNNEYLLAPQVGAGIKNENKFTGIVMGVKDFNNPESRQREVGLFGYHDGVQSIFLDAKTGKAEFGKSGTGQIIIDPSNVDENGKSNPTATIKSGEYYYDPNSEKGKGMLIDFNTPEIKFGSGNFEVTSKGYITVKGGGSIAGWNIGDNTLSSSTFEIDSLEPKIKAGSNEETGFELTENSLRIGNIFKIEQTENSTQTLTLGNLNEKAKQWSIASNKIQNSYIKYGTSDISYNSESTNGIYIGTDGIRFGDKLKFDVEKNEFEINTNVATIAGWTAQNDDSSTLEKENKLHYNNEVGLGSFKTWNGESSEWVVHQGFWAGGNEGPSFFVTQNGNLITNGNVTIMGNTTISGNATFHGNIYTSNGTISSWKIGTNSITTENNTIGMGRLYNDANQLMGFWVGQETDNNYFKATVDEIKVQGKIYATGGEIGGIGIDNALGLSLIHIPIEGDYQNDNNFAIQMLKNGIFRVGKGQIYQDSNDNNNLHCFEEVEIAKGRISFCSTFQPIHQNEDGSYSGPRKEFGIITAEELTLYSTTDNKCYKLTADIIKKIGGQEVSVQDIIYK